MKRLLYFYPSNNTFIAADEEILGKKFKINSFLFKSNPKWHTPYSFISQFIFILFRIKRCDILFSQFSGYHSFIPSLVSKIFKIPHYIVLHGTECNNFPEYHYGFILRPLLFWFSNKSLAWATKLLPVSSSLVRADYTYMNTKYKQQGFKVFYSGLKTPYEVIYNGISPEKFFIQKTGIRENKTFITAAIGLDSANRRGIKGLDLIISLAEITPENEYTFIGAEKPSDLDIPDNIRIVPYVPHFNLLNYYNANAFYLQLSVSEGFGISVCEAMLCGCIPIVSDVGMLPEIAGKDGYVLKKKDVVVLLAIIEKAKKEYHYDQMERCRNHVIDHYDQARRREKLLEVV